jgi:hypothetical protein
VQARRKSEQLIDLLYDPALHGLVKPRTYRNIAQKLFLNTAKKKVKSNKELYNGRQLRFLRRNLKHIETLIAAYGCFPLKYREQKYLLVLHTVYEQQLEMHRTHTKSIPHRIVNIHQPHVRPIVRGKDKAKVEFGSKLQVSLVGGFTFIDRLSREAFNEGQCLLESVEGYKRRFGYYPKEVLADQIYCNRENRRWMKEKGIRLVAKPLSRPVAGAVAVHLRPGERNPIEGKFGQGKLTYGLDLHQGQTQRDLRIMDCMYSFSTKPRQYDEAGTILSLSPPGVYYPGAVRPSKTAPSSVNRRVSYLASPIYISNYAGLIFVHCGCKRIINLINFTIMARKYSKATQEKVHEEMHEMKKGKLKSGSGKKVTDPKQAIAIGLSEARKEGKKVPEKPAGKKAAAKKSAGTKKTAAKKSTATKKTAIKKNTDAKKTAAKKVTGTKKTVTKKSTVVKKAVAKKTTTKGTARRTTVQKKKAGKK